MALNIGSIVMDAFNDVFKVLKWTMKLSLKPLSVQNNKTNTNNNNKPQNLVSIKDGLKNDKNKKTNSNRSQFSSNLSTKLQNK